MKKKHLLYSAVGIFWLVMAVNIYSSQDLHPLFFNLVSRQQKTDAVVFLKKIAQTPAFPSQLGLFQKIYGADLVNEVKADELARAKEREKLQQVLEKNAKARDILVKLAILYYEDNNHQKAKEYYRKAQTIDPEVKIDQLDQLR